MLQLQEDTTLGLCMIDNCLVTRKLTNCLSRLLLIFIVLLFLGEASLVSSQVLHLRSGDRIVTRIDAGRATELTATTLNTRFHEDCGEARFEKTYYLILQFDDLLITVTRKGLLESGIELVGCIENPGECEKSGRCLTRGIWEEASKAMYDKLNSITLSMMLEMGKGV